MAGNFGQSLGPEGNLQQTTNKDPEPLPIL